MEELFNLYRSMMSEALAKQRAEDYYSKLKTAVENRDVDSLGLIRYKENGVSRKIVSTLTGIEFKGNQSQIDEQLRQWYGAEKYDELQEQKSKLRQELKEKEEEEDRRAEQERLESIRAKFLSGDEVLSGELVDLARHLGINVHPRTAGSIYKNIYSITGKSIRYRTTPTNSNLNSVSKLYHEINKCITS